MARKPEPPADTFGKELEESIRAKEALLAAIKYDVGQRTAQAQEGKSEYPSVFELQALDKLELRLRSDKLLLQARRMTRTSA